MGNLDLAGQVFGRLTVVRQGRVAILPSGGRESTWVCICDCGGWRTVRTRALRGGSTRSCGCLRREVSRNRHRTHGHTPVGSRSRIYNIWSNMLSRCYDPKDDSYPWYGGRGIKVHPRWHKFIYFLIDMGPDMGKVMHRLDSGRDYGPGGNCVWVGRRDHAREHGIARSRHLWPKVRGIRLWHAQHPELTPGELACMFGVPTRWVWHVLAGRRFSHVR